MTYVLLAVAVLITAVNFTLLYRSRKFKKHAAQQYQELIHDLKARTLKEMKKNHLTFDKTYPVVTDTNEGYLVSLDTKNHKISFTDSTSVKVMDFTDLVTSSVTVIPDPADSRFFTQVFMEIHTKTQEQPIIIKTGCTKRKQKSTMGTFILDTAYQLNDVIQGAVKAPALP